MKKLRTLMLGAAVLLALTGSAHAYLFDMTFNASSDGFTLTFTRGLPNILPQTIQLTGAEDPPQTLRIMPGLSVDLSLTALGPDARQQLTLHYAITSVLRLLNGQEGDITLPFEHGYITNRLFFYDQADPSIHYDVQGSATVSMFQSGYSLQFGLSDLSGLVEAQAEPGYNEIHQTIYRDNAAHDQFADINLVFNPRLLYNKVAFDITMTARQDTGQDPYPAPSTFTGTLPAPYGMYHFWFYRDSKN